VYDPPSIGGTHVIYVLHDITKPELYGGLPANPQIPPTFTVWPPLVCVSDPASEKSVLGVTKIG